MVMGIVRKLLIVFSLLFLAGLTAFSQPDNLSYNELLGLAKQGDSKSQALLAYYLKEGIGVEKNKNQAREWAQTASLYQNGLGYWLLAQIGQEMGDTPISNLYYLNKALECNYPLAFSLFGRLYEAGSSEFGIEQDERRAFSYLQQAADKGDTEAAAYIAYRYLKREKDPVNAFKYFRLAATQGDAASMGMLAIMYSYGVGTDPDPKAALEWYQKAADAGDALGFLGLAECYRLGLATSPNQQDAIKYYQKCSALSPRLQYILGYYYALGEGTKQDVSKALSLLRQSADAGYVYAQAFLGITQFEGVAPFKDEKDVSKALNDLKSAYENPDFGILPASVRRNIYRYLSGYYRFGRGVTRDVAFADELMKKADALPEEDATPAPYAMVDKMSFEECLEAYMPTSLSLPGTVLKQVSFDYPEPETIESIPPEKEEVPVPKSEPKTEPKSEPKPTPQTVTRQTVPVKPVKPTETSTFNTRYVLSANASLFFPENEDKIFSTGVSFGVYDIAGSQLGAEAGFYFCPVGTPVLASDGMHKAIAPYGFDASVVFRATKGIYPKAGIGFYSYKESPADNSEFSGLCGIFGISFLLGKSLCLEVGTRYYPETKVLSSSVVSTEGKSYSFPIAKTVFKGFSPMIGIGWAF